MGVGEILEELFSSDAKPFHIQISSHAMKLEVWHQFGHTTIHHKPWGGMNIRAIKVNVKPSEDPSLVINSIVRKYLGKEPKEMTTDQEKKMDQIKLMIDFAFTELGTGFVGRMDEQGNIYDLTMKVNGANRTFDDIAVTVDVIKRIRDAANKILQSAENFHIYHEKITRETDKGQGTRSG